MLERRGLLRGRVAASIGAAFAMMLVGCGPNVTPTTPASAFPPASSAATDGLLPTAHPTAASVAQPCTLAELSASHGLVEGAAGSRFTTIALIATVECSIDAFPAVGLRDSTGEVLVGSAAGGPGRIELVEGSSYSSDVRLANWCAPEPAFPLRLVIHLGEEELPVTGDSFAEEGDLPPCNGEGGPILEASGWELP